MAQHNIGAVPARHVAQSADAEENDAGNDAVPVIAARSPRKTACVQGEGELTG